MKYRFGLIFFWHVKCHYYRMIKMKKMYFILALSTAMLSTSCYMSRTSGHSGKVPPGQAKKAAGTKSAKHFAPGQQYKK